MKGIKGSNLNSWTGVLPFTLDGIICACGAHMRREAWRDAGLILMIGLMSFARRVHKPITVSFLKYGVIITTRQAASQARHVKYVVRRGRRNEKEKENVIQRSHLNVRTK